MPMTAAEFEARYRANPDPWGYASSPYEREKYAATLNACGHGPFTAGLELGGSIGVFSAQLAPRCRSLVTVDGAPTAVAAARRRLAGQDERRGHPGLDPRGHPRALVRPGGGLGDPLLPVRPRSRSNAVDAEGPPGPGGRLVAVHWRPAGAERPFTAAEVHAILKREPWLALLESRPTDDYLLDVLEHR